MANIRTVKSIKGFHQHKSPDLMLKLSFNSKFMMKYIIPMSFDKSEKERKRRKKYNRTQGFMFIFWQKQKEKQFSLRVLRARLCVRHISFLAIHILYVLCIYINTRSHSLQVLFSSQTFYYLFTSIEWSFEYRFVIYIWVCSMQDS